VEKQFNGINFTNLVALHFGNRVRPAVPVELPDARKAVGADGIDILQHAALTHQVKPGGHRCDTCT
jgi:hypothetical protein